MEKFVITSTASSAVWGPALCQNRPEALNIRIFLNTGIIYSGEKSNIIILVCPAAWERNLRADHTAHV